MEAVSTLYLYSTSVSFVFSFVCRPRRTSCRGRLFCCNVYHSVIALSIYTSYSL